MKQSTLLLSLALLLLGGTSLQGQPEFSGGFKAGLNFSNLDGPLELDDDGSELEANNLTTGFHIGATFALAFTDRFGAKADLLYSQKGAEIEYDGPSFYIFYSRTGTAPLTVLGNRRSSIDVTNSYIDVPVMVYGRLGPIELEAGVSAAVLVNSVATGGATFTTPAGTSYTISYDYNFLRDEVGVAAIKEEDAASTGASFIVPTTVGAYYESLTDENRYSRLDFGLVGGLSVFINQGLYLGGRINYGLSDVTNREQDIALRALSGGEVSLRDDKDRNISLQASVGFRF